MKTYDFIKAKELIEKNKDKLDKAYLGISEDWEWTSETVFVSGKYQRSLPDNADDIYTEYLRELETKSILDDSLQKYDDQILVRGIYGSCWGTPELILVFKDGNHEAIPCYNNYKGF